MFPTPESRLRHYEDAHGKAAEALIGLENSELAANVKLRRLEAFRRAEAAWKDAYGSLRLPENEHFVRFAIATKMFITLRRCRQKLNGEIPDAEQAALFARIHTLTNALPALLLSPTEIDEPEELISLEAELGEIPPSAMTQNHLTVTFHLPSHISDLLNNDPQYFILDALTWNNIDVGDMDNFVAQLRNRKVLVVTALSSGAMRIPFVVEALKKEGVTDVSLEVHSPVVRASGVQDYGKLTKQNKTPPLLGQKPEVVLILDDSINDGATAGVLRTSVHERYGTHATILSDTKNAAQ